MTTKHTPGPWAVADVGEVVVCATGRTLCDVYSSPATGDEQADADANLIAAAPDLLEALEAAHWWLVFFGTDHLEPVRARCRAAIAKARGQSTSTDTARATE
jgi:hypothetical protein